MGGLSCGAECLRFMIYTVNLLMVIGSFALIVLCGFIFGKLDVMMELCGQNASWIIVSTIMVTAVIIFLVSLLGCCGAMKENTCMLKAFIVIMFTILLILVVVAGLAYGYKDPARNTVYNHMEEKMKDYNPSNDNSTIINSFWDDMQSTIQCCGIDNSTDWSLYCDYYMKNSTSDMDSTRDMNSTSDMDSTSDMISTSNGNSTSHLQFPKSCLGSNDKPYPQGCLDKAESWLHTNIWILVGIIAGCAAAMLLAMCCVCRLVRSINSYEEFDVSLNHQSHPW